ncbi:chaplin [Streptomyces paludis]|uniref:Chaplin n=1 Tax=Streptomyces paludis TaxID=2282738 RepID=A0A345HK15_9ACTN|nr:chaplin [Streptomyces paludis]AXG77039.1 chaplin [Streptomyces paludis]
MRQVTRKSLVTVAAAGGVLALGGGYAQADAGAGSTTANSPGVLSGNNVQVPVHVPVNVCGNTIDVVGVLNPAFGNNCANVSGHPAKQQSGGGHGDAYGGGAHTTTPSHGGPHGGTRPGGPHEGGSHPGATHTVPAGGSHAGGGAHAGNTTANSPGVGSGNSVEVPIDIPVNVCGNSIDIIGLLNPVFGNGCANVETPVVTPPVGPEHPVTPGRPGQPTEVRAVPPAPEQVSTPSTPNTPETHSVAKPGEEKEVLASTGAGGLGIAIPAGAGLLLAGSILYRRARAAA